MRTPNFAEDYDVAALTAEALMVRTPWKLWDLENRVPAEGTDTLEAVEIVEPWRGSNGHGTAPRATTFLHHIMEMSPNRNALEAGDKL